MKYPIPRRFRRAASAAAGILRARRARWLFAALALVLGAAGVVAPARADEGGTYLRTAAILLDESKRSTDWMLTHEGDTELARVLHDMAEARVRASRQVVVPKELDRAHPHLLLTLETVER